MIEEKVKKPRKASVKKAAVTQEGTAKTKVAPKASKAAKPVVAKAKAAESAKVKQWPSHEEIALLAHRYYEERGWKDGFHDQDWFRAEQELLEAS